jgi:hypothetical protein
MALPEFSLLTTVMPCVCSPSGSDSPLGHNRGCSRSVLYMMPVRTCWVPPELLTKLLSRLLDSVHCVDMPAFLHSSSARDHDQCEKLAPLLGRPAHGVRCFSDVSWLWCVRISVTLKQICCTAWFGARFESETVLT